MIARRRLERETRPDTTRYAYVLVARGPDGRPRIERFNDVSAYRARLAALRQAAVSPVSVDEILGLLEG
jgi:hypothetical protein